MRRRATLLATAVTLSALPASAQQPTFVVQGRVTEADAGPAIAGASVVIGGIRGVVTDARGIFRFSNVSAGPLRIRVEAIGYAPWSETLVVRGDTVLQVSLEPAPVPLDTLRVRSHTISIHGSVVDASNGRDLRDVEVGAGPITTRTNGAGHFRLRRVPAGGPVFVEARLFGYLPAAATIDADTDAIIAFELKPDAVARRMIAEQVERLERRGHPYRSVTMQPIDREELVRKESHSLFDLLRENYGPSIERVRCILIDDHQRYEGFDLLKLYAAGDLQRVELLFGGHMLRIYTRDYVEAMMAGRVELARPVYVDQVDPPMCR